jgi:AcrR family transcriptional regulator
LPNTQAAASGLARRERRIPLKETEERMLGAAVDVLTEEGLTVSLDHISFEEVIRRAGVSRTAVYRRWPYKDLFFSDLVTRMAQGHIPPVVREEVAVLKDVVAQGSDRLATPEGRSTVVAELFRRLALLDFDMLRQSATWRTYLSLNATFLSISDDDLRRRVGDAMKRNEEEFVARIAGNMEWLTTLFGYRLRAEAGQSFEALVIMLIAALRGLVLMSLYSPRVAALRVKAKPLGAAEESEWSVAALSAISLAWGMLEPDPEVVWSEERVESIRSAFAHLTPDGL